MKELFYKIQDKIKVSSPRTLSEIMTVLTVAYLVGIVMGYLPKDQRIDVATLLVVIFSILVILFIRRPTLFIELFARIEEIQIGEFKAKLKEVEKAQEKQQEVINHQQKIINQLVTYSLCEQAYGILYGLSWMTEYLYHDDDTFRRWMYVLLDDGLIQPKPPCTWLKFDAAMDKKNR